jgi:exodeoxyribonuclease VII large subunit
MESGTNLFNSTIWAVGELTRYIRQRLESDYRLQELWVAGEVSNVSRPASGHLYFSLKDDQASLRCVMWKPQVLALAHIPANGDRLEVFGRIGVYEASGQYQLYAERLRPAGEGERYQEFLRLKARLDQEGLFAPERKRPLPAWPRTIGVVTSPTGAALRDVLHVFRRRFPLLHVLISPTVVQGEGAPDGILRALQILNRDGRSDVILVVRGGGSIEDLWAFNDERVVRAVAESKIPVVSGIGHETDLVLVDFAADLRAATPSAAAEVATPDRTTLLDAIRRLAGEISAWFEANLEERRAELSELHTRLLRSSPRSAIASALQRGDELSLRALAALRHKLALAGAGARGLAQTLQAVGPQAILARGYAIVVRQPEGHLVNSIHQIVTGDILEVRVQDGEFGAVVDEHHPG